MTPEQLAEWKAQAAEKDCHAWVQIGECSRGDKCAFKHDESKKGVQQRRVRFDTSAQAASAAPGSGGPSSVTERTSSESHTPLIEEIDSETNESSNTPEPTTTQHATNNNNNKNNNKIAHLQDCFECV